MRKLALFALLVLIVLVALLAACERQDGGSSLSAGPSSASESLTTQMPVPSERGRGYGDPGYRGSSQPGRQRQSEVGSFTGPGGTKVREIPPPSGGRGGGGHHR
jgi:hypothetical protein